MKIVLNRIEQWFVENPAWYRRGFLKCVWESLDQVVGEIYLYTIHKLPQIDMRPSGEGNRGRKPDGPTASSTTLLFCGEVSVEEPGG
ncbi:MAG: hypothetical protein F4120_06610 [Rhodothermaceae bacterium]|nr:hypothetical protein [Rhodothermaceae bacterium]MYI17279.1 hypothetical protein [Rhodothermaceae bacterium]